MPPAPRQAAEPRRGWISTYLLAVFINAYIEWLALRTIFKMSPGKRGFWIMVVANGLSVGVAFSSLLFLPDDHP